MGKINVVSLGCDKNRVDAEYMIGMLLEQGHVLVDDPADAEIVLINSCCFIGDAKEESIQTILELAAYKETGCCQALILTGCLAERYREEVRKELPEVDALLGTNSYDEICRVIEEALEGTHPEVLKPLTGLPAVTAKRVNTTGGYYAYLKIAEGCDKHCTYCVIPSVRGAYRSVPMEALLQEAGELVSSGARELILVAQETTLYGIDLYGERRLPALLDALERIPELRWIRLLYCYPEEITKELVDAIKRNQKVCHYLDMPIQHVSDDILKRMGRRTTKKDLTERISMIRREVPDICLRTTLICGFPGETEEEHRELLDFVRDMHFDRLGVFAYSEEEGTDAAGMAHQVPEEVKRERCEEVMALSESLIFADNQEKIGQTMEVMIEGRLSDDQVYVARTYRDAPEIDGYLFFPCEGELMSGDFLRVTVTGTNNYDLIGEPDEKQGGSL